METNGKYPVETFVLENVSINRITKDITSVSDNKDIPCDFNELSAKLSNQVFKNTIDSLSVTEDQFDILRNDQNCLIDDVSAVKKELMQETMIKEIEHAIKDINLYRSKMVQIKKTMISIQESAVRLKKEAKRLEAEKLKEASRKKEYLKKSAEKDEEVMAKFSSDALNG